MKERTGLLGYLDEVERKLERIRSHAHNRDNGYGSIEGDANTALHALRNALTVGAQLVDELDIANRRIAELEAR